MTSNETEVEMDWVNVYFALNHAVIIVMAEAPQGWEEDDEIWDALEKEIGTSI